LASVVFPFPWGADEPVDPMGAALAIARGFVHDLDVMQVSQRCKGCES
jgi:hypothetical protein